MLNSLLHCNWVSCNFGQHIIRQPLNLKNYPNKQNIIITKRTYENNIPIQKCAYLCNTYGILFVFVHKFTQSILLGEVYKIILFNLDKAKTNYSISHISTLILCFIKITYPVALSMLLMTPWWLLDWYSGLQEFPNTNES